MSLLMHLEKRRSERRSTQRAVKVYDPATGRYVGGTVRNISTGGALLELRGGIASRIGSRVALAIDEEGGPAVVTRADMTPAVVRRLGNATATRLVAVEFAAAQSAARAA